MMHSWFRDRLGKFAGEEGGAILELLLLRREIAQAQAKLMVKRAELRSHEFLAVRDVARELVHKGDKVGKIHAKEKVS